MKLVRALRTHWPEYLMEAWGLAVFMISAGVFDTLLEDPHSTVHHALPSPLVRRLIMGLAMGLTAVGIIYSPWGMRSGAHINPAVTLAFWRLGKITGADAFFYGVFQCLGGVAGTALVAALFGEPFLVPPVSAVATVPGTDGPAAAFVAELGISFLTMAVVLWTSNTPRLAAWTGMLVGVLIVLYVVFESPLSGFSQNPARSLGSAVVANVWTSFWIYLTAPFLGMLGAAEVYAAVHGRAAVLCAKLHHAKGHRCIFCEHRRAAATLRA